MASGPMAFGFDIVIVGVVTAIPAFLETFGELYGEQLILPSLWLSLWNAMMSFGLIVGSVINGPITDRFGRKVSMATGAFILSIGIAIVYTSDEPTDITHRRIMFMFGKIVIGTGLSMLLSTCQTFNSEVAPTKLRAPLLSLFQFSATLGMLIAAVVAQNETKIGLQRLSYRVCFATQWALAGTALLAAVIIPESPVYYLRRGNFDGARKSLLRLHSADTIDSQIVALQAALDQERAFEESNQSATYLQCFKGTNLRRTRIVVYASILQQFLGVSFISNGTYFLITAGMTPSNSVMVLEIVSGLSMVSNIISWFLASSVGRRNSLLFGSIGVGIIWTSVGISACFKGSTALWYTGVAMNVVMVFYNLAAGGIGPIVAAETSSIRLRAKTNSVGFFASSLMSWAFTFFVPYMFNVGNADWGGKTAFFFTGLSFIAALVIFLEIPEMKNRTYVELDEMFEKHIPTRRFKEYARETD
ncbi:Major facilitator superfamily domain, general substrate transporter [Penicillium occitanis (nom. inval.)]|nr:Major facilitator superfamily domain, general substrate transporter [Penicillium occitanis (nom. inval.)]PCG98241.1 hypothetical protein PENOC_064230 [Penicillium occitanis (nom. inval.)]